MATEIEKEVARLVLEIWDNSESCDLAVTYRAVAVSLAEKNQRLLEALTRYGRHEDGCTWRESLCSQPGCIEYHATPCSCGFKSVIQK